LNNAAKKKSVRRSLRKRRALNSVGSLICVAAIGLVLSNCSTSASSQQDNRHFAAAACKLLSPPPPPVNAPNAFVAISVKESLISDLTKTGETSLERVAHDLIAAASTETRTGSATPMIRALTEGVNACHQLGLRTAESN
jgi:hypothetical protein